MIVHAAGAMEEVADDANRTLSSKASTLIWMEAILLELGTELMVQASSSKPF